MSDGVRIRGLGVSQGIAIGEPVVHENRPISTLRIPIPGSQVEAEVTRFVEAVNTTVSQILENRDRAASQMLPWPCLRSPSHVALAVRIVIVWDSFS